MYYILDLFYNIWTNKKSFIYNIILLSFCVLNCFIHCDDFQISLLLYLIGFGLINIFCPDKETMTIEYYLKFTTIYFIIGLLIAKLFNLPTLFIIISILYGIYFLIIYIYALSRENKDIFYIVNPLFMPFHTVEMRKPYFILKNTNGYKVKVTLKIIKGLYNLLKQIECGKLYIADTNIEIVKLLLSAYDMGYIWIKNLNDFIVIDPNQNNKYWNEKHKKNYKKSYKMKRIFKKLYNRNDIDLRIKIEFSKVKDLPNNMSCKDFIKKLNIQSKKYYFDKDEKYFVEK